MLGPELLAGLSPPSAASLPKLGHATASFPKSDDQTRLAEIRVEWAAVTFSGDFTTTDCSSCTPGVGTYLYLKVGLKLMYVVQRTTGLGEVLHQQ